MAFALKWVLRKRSSGLETVYFQRRMDVRVLGTGRGGGVKTYKCIFSLDSWRPWGNGGWRQCSCEIVFSGVCNVNLASSRSKPLITGSIWSWKKSPEASVVSFAFSFLSSWDTVAVVQQSQPAAHVKSRWRDASFSNSPGDALASPCWSVSPFPLKCNSLYKSRTK